MELIISRVEMSQTYMQKNKGSALASPWKLRNIKEKPVVSKTEVAYHALFHAWGLRLCTASESIQKIRNSLYL